MTLDLRIDLAAVAIKRKQWARAESLLESVRANVTQARFAALQPMYSQQTYNLAALGPSKNAELAAASQAKVTALLAAQQRQIYDPVGGQWLGAPVPGAAQNSEEILRAANRLREAYAGVK